MIYNEKLVNLGSGMICKERLETLQLQLQLRWTQQTKSYIALLLRSFQFGYLHMSYKNDVEYNFSWKVISNFHNMKVCQLIFTFNGQFCK